MTKTKGTIVIFDDINKKTMKISVTFDGDPAQALSDGIAARENRKDVTHFCLFGEYKAYLTLEETGEVLAEGKITANAFSGKYHTSCHNLTKKEQ